MTPEQPTPKEVVAEKIAHLRAELAQGKEVTQTFSLGEVGFLLREIFAHHQEVDRAHITCRAEKDSKIRVVGTSKTDGAIASFPGFGDIRSVEVVLSTSQTGEIQWKLEKLNGKGGLLLGLANRLAPKPLIQHELAIGQENLLQAHARGVYAIGPDSSLRATFTPVGRR